MEQGLRCEWPTSSETFPALVRNRAESVDRPCERHQTNQDARDPQNEAKVNEYLSGVETSCFQQNRVTLAFCDGDLGQSEHPIVDVVVAHGPDLELLSPEGRNVPWYFEVQEWQVHEYLPDIEEQPERSLVEACGIRDQQPTPDHYGH